MEIGESVVQSVILHQVGNRLREEPLVLAEQCFAITDAISNLILGGYLRGIVSSKNQYMLTHETDIALNDVSHHVSSFFLNEPLLSSCLKIWQPTYMLLPIILILLLGIFLSFFLNDSS